MTDLTRPCLLIILDGWGIRDASENNAIKMATTPFMDQLLATWPHTRLRCHGEAVGLPDGVMGNSEVGHMNIGAGRVVYQNLLRINNAIADGSFAKNPAFDRVMRRVHEKKKALHLIGLLSDGGVHSHIDHLKALLLLARDRGIKQVFVHAILDGRDTPPTSGVTYLKQLAKIIKQVGNGVIASICGRYYAMDRDTRWDRVEKAHCLYTAGEGTSALDAVQAVEDAYARGENDEFVKPIVMTDPAGNPVGQVTDGDGVIFFNFRADRAREITQALTDPDFSNFKRACTPEICDYVCMTLYDNHFTLPLAFPPVHLEDLLGEVISGRGLSQLRIAETEKYAHVTYFFNGGEEAPFEKEDRCLIPSPREVDTYDQKPEMSALKVTDELLKRLENNRYALVVLNFANMDMVGHTGILEAAIKACETVDSCLARIIPRVLELNGTVIVTADHGNSETMVDEKGRPHTAHTLNPVRLILVDEARKSAKLKEGALCDIAPTILDIIGIKPPEKMTGHSLILKAKR
jgi:2,3-bisphosphoglycerate-independent phosphoglycerate mutase